jgi:hypothetical protein
MSESLSLSREFTVAAHSRAIDACTDIEELRRVAKTLLRAWQIQSQFSQQYGAEALGLRSGEPRGGRP